jgi:hypothetical protein
MSMELILGEKQRIAKLEYKLAELLKEVNEDIVALLDGIDEAELLGAISGLHHAEATLWARPVEFGIFRFTNTEPYYELISLDTYIATIDSSNKVTDKVKEKLKEIKFLELELCG